MQLNPIDVENTKKLNFRQQSMVIDMYKLRWKWMHLAACSFPVPAETTRKVYKANIFNHLNKTAGALHYSRILQDKWKNSLGKSLNI